MDRKLLDLLVCPATRQPLLKASAEQLQRLNAAIGAGTVADLDGQAVAGPQAEALVTKDGKTVYRVDDGIPVLLPESGIATATISGWAA